MSQMPAPRSPAAPSRPTSAELTISHTTVSKVHANFDGGMAFVTQSGTVKMVGVHVSSASSISGAAVFVDSLCTLQTSASTQFDSCAAQGGWRRRVRQPRLARAPHRHQGHPMLRRPVRWRHVRD